MRRVRGCLVASDATGLRDVLVGVGREPAVLGITVAQIEYERAEVAALRELADAAARRFALAEACDKPGAATAGEAFAAAGVPSGDMLGAAQWLREYRAARALRGGGGA